MFFGRGGASGKSSPVQAALRDCDKPHPGSTNHLISSAKGARRLATSAGLFRIVKDQTRGRRRLAASNVVAQNQSHRMPPESFRPVRSMLATLEMWVAISELFLKPCSDRSDTTIYREFVSFLSKTPAARNGRENARRAQRASFFAPNCIFHSVG